MLKVYTFKITTKDRGEMKLFTTKAFRARFAECARSAETQVVYIMRPRGRLLKLEPVPKEDVQPILDLLGPDTEREMKTRGR